MERANGDPVALHPLIHPKFDGSWISRELLPDGGR
jgi:hypothetical protein